ncbi:MAG: CopG family transcriptional regulator [Schumannella sp.]|nr:ribbon-helix-helix protein, CopG family [Microbacteriaceae bacterium]
MTKTTLYLPDDLKRAIEAEAVRRGESEAEVIREALRSSIPAVVRRPRGALFSGREPIAERVDDLLAGFGE